MVFQRRLRRHANYSCPLGGPAITRTAYFIAPIARVRDPAGLRARGDTRKLAAIAVSPVIAIAITAAAPARIFELAPALFCLAAVFTVAADFLFEFLFGLVDAPGASIVAVARLHRRGTAKQQEPAQRCREKRSPSKRSLMQFRTSGVQTSARDLGPGWSDSLPATSTDVKAACEGCTGWRVWAIPKGIWLMQTCSNAGRTMVPAVGLEPTT